MPWAYRWTIGYDEASGHWSQVHGYNGAFLDGSGGQPPSPPGKLEWINHFGLRFYTSMVQRPRMSKHTLNIYSMERTHAHGERNCRRAGCAVARECVQEWV